jgi:hypothetical protein
MDKRPNRLSWIRRDSHAYALRYTYIHTYAYAYIHTYAYAYTYAYGSLAFDWKRTLYLNHV